MTKKVFPAKIEYVETVTDFVNEVLEVKECPMKAVMQIDIAIDELFSNIAYYAYDNNDGDAEVGVEVTDNPKQIVLSFADSAKPYNPLEKEDADTTLSAEEREIGGLGIFIVKKSMDEMLYEYKDNKNILTIKKNI